MKYRFLPLLTLFVLALVAVAPTHAEKKGKGGKKKAEAAQAAQNEPAATSADTISTKEPAVDRRNLGTPPAEYWAADLAPVYQALREGDLPGAQRLLRAAQGPGRDKVERYYLLAGMIDLSRGDSAAAVRQFAQARDARPSDSDTLLLLARAKRGAHPGNAGLAAALALLEESVWFDKFKLFKADDARMEIASVHLARDSKEQASAVLAQVTSKDAGSTEALLALGDTLFADGKQREAEDRFRAALKADPDSEQAKRKLSATLLSPVDRSVRKQEVAEVEQLLSSVIGERSGEELYRDPSFPDLVRTMIYSGKLEQAESQITGALAKFPNNPDFGRLKKQIDIEQAVKAAKESTTAQ